MKLWLAFEDTPAAPSPEWSVGLSRNWSVSLLCAFLLLLVFSVYRPALSSGFINYDDEIYVTANPRVQAGITGDGLAWAFAQVHGEQTYWHPLTWVSHMLDCQLYGLKPWGHHLTNVLLHAVNTLLVFFVFMRMTGAFWRCAVLAALFSVHPLQVDTVAWVAERKNLLSTLFWLLTIWAYVRYGERPALGRYALVLLLFVLGLMCKPVLVTLPFVLMLLDYWPLRRFQPTALERQFSTLGRLLGEKVPLFLLAAASSVLTVMAHRSLGLLEVSPGIALDHRIENALVSYLRYLGNTVWPTKLAIFYPYPNAWPLWEVLLSILLLCAVSLAAVSLRRSRPWLLVGWLWFLGVLVPFIGLVQAGAQAMADRFMYVPLLGLLIMIVWGAFDLAIRWRGHILVLFAAAVVVIMFGATLAHRQTGYWKNSELLFRHAVLVTENNALAHNNLGAALLSNGRPAAAAAQFQMALQTKPDNIDLLNNLACAFQKQGFANEALLHLQRALALNPSRADTHNNLGSLWLQTGRAEEGIAQYQEALRLKPDHAQAHANLGAALLQQQRIDEAIVHLRLATKLAPDDTSAHRNLGAALARTGQLDEALFEFQQVLRLAPADAPTLCTVGIMLGKRGRLDEAITHLAEAIRLQPENAEARCNLGITLGKQGRLDPAIAHLTEAIRLQPENAEAQCSLGVLLGMKGHLDEAISHLQEAVRLKPGYVDAQNNLRTALDLKAPSASQPHNPLGP
jgi:tetratricopeptide (TPR) repeat protein